MISTILAATTQPSELPISTALVAGVLFLAVAIAFFALRRGPKFGPERLAANESPGQFLLITAAGLFSIFIADTIYVAMHPSLATTNAAQTLPPRQQLTLGLARYVIALIVLLVANIFYRKDGLRRLGLNFWCLPLAIPIALISALSIVPLTFLVGKFAADLWDILQRAHPVKHQLLILLDERPDPLIKWLIIVSAGVSAPIVEELLFRGHLQTFLRRVTRSPWIAIFITSFLFAIIHEWWTIPPIFFLALSLGYVYERTNNLWVPIFVHAIFNGINLYVTLHPVR